MRRLEPSASAYSIAWLPPAGKFISNQARSGRKQATVKSTRKRAHIGSLSALIAANHLNASVLNHQ
jgi:hypothetical protein